MSVHFHELAWRNLSPQRKAEMTEKQNRLNAALEARVLQEQWPDREQISSEAYPFSSLIFQKSFLE